ncbi:hypothetical protein GCM10017600_86030 [Streptosporangium carneum]|uniref:Uncharacterized protein n=1 Tax=Streptosporangium carneum TaxID=47481 RepID=A0A9W6MIG9_9ACTN|nr:hypothetical protein GCM10017600_86030 [Streptosporangium carneum]
MNSALIGFSAMLFSFLVTELRSCADWLPPVGGHLFWSGAERSGGCGHGEGACEQGKGA